MRWCIVAFVILVSARPAIAQPGPSVDLGVHANLTALSLPGPEINGARPLSDVYGTGFGGDVHLDVSFLAFGLRLSGDYIMFSPDQDKYRNALASLVG